MLVLSRKVGEEIIIGENIRLKVVAIQGNQVRLGFVAPRSVAIHRQELLEGAPPQPVTEAAPTTPR
jgi:carbon storage regulator